MDRRKFVLMSGGVFMTALAGCASDSGETSDESSDDTSDNGVEDNDGVEDENGNGEDEGEEESGDTESDYVDEIDGQVELAYGEVAELSNGVEFTVHSVTVEDELGGEVPEERGAFAVLEVEGYNGGDEEQRLPSAMGGEIELLFGDQQVGVVFRSAVWRETDYEEYEGHEVQPGVRREGNILFEVDSGLDQADIDVLWQGGFLYDTEEDIEVRWTDG